MSFAEVFFTDFIFNRFIYGNNLLQVDVHIQTVSSVTFEIKRSLLGVNILVNETMLATGKYVEGHPAIPNALAIPKTP